jgi:hypothetical protein
MWRASALSSVDPGHAEDGRLWFQALATRSLPPRYSRTRPAPRRLGKLCCPNRSDWRRYALRRTAPYLVNISVIRGRRGPRLSFHLRPQLRSDSGTAASKHKCDRIRLVMTAYRLALWIMLCHVAGDDGGSLHLRIFGGHRDKPVRVVIRFLRFWRRFGRQLRVVWTCNSRPDSCRSAIDIGNPGGGPIDFVRDGFVDGCCCGMECLHRRVGG